MKDNFHDYTFSLLKVNISSSGAISTASGETTKNLESSFTTYTSSVKTGFIGYVKFEGLLDKGRRKDIYTEAYADSDRLRVHQGSGIAREATTMELTLAFTGSTRKDSYKAFYDYVKNGIIQYNDTARGKYAFMVLMDAVAPSDDEWKGSEPYILCKFKFQNLYGTTFSSINGTSHLPVE